MLKLTPKLCLSRHIVTAVIPPIYLSQILSMVNLLSHSNMIINRLHPNMADPLAWLCHIYIFGKALNGFAVFILWKKINPAFGNRLGIITMPTHGKNKDIGTINDMSTNNHLL